MKKITFAMLILTFLLFIGIIVLPNQSLANTNYDSGSKRDKYLNIITCNKMQYEMVKTITGNKHNVNFMFSKEEDINKFKYNDNVINNISSMDLFFYSGKGYEKWANSLINELDISVLGVIDLSRGIRNEYYSTEGINPYYWTSEDNYKIALFNIKNSLQDKDPVNREYYEERYRDAINYVRIKANIYNSGNKGYKKNIYIALDEYMDYFYKDLGIDVIKVKSTDLEAYIKENNIDSEKVVLLKENNTVYESDKYKIINFKRYDYRLDELICNNIKSFVKTVQKK